MKCWVIFLFGVLGTQVEAVDRRRLVQTPLPQNGFDLERYLGDWYGSFFYTPCSWNGAKDFTNFATTYRFEPSKNHLVIDIVWRNRRCVATTNDYVPKKAPGVFFLKDTFGDVITSESIIVATDYTSFVIKWGCARRLANGFCEDPYVIVKSRRPDPHPKTLKVVQGILFDLFELNLSEMTRYVHDLPCKRAGYGSKYLPVGIGK